MIEESRLVKIKIKKLYSLPSGNIVRVVKLDWAHNNVIVHNYHSHANESLDYDVAPAVLSPVYRIGDVSKMLGKKPATIRKYEQMGLIPKVKKISLNFTDQIVTRVYTVSDVEELVEFFDHRKPVGRPAVTNMGGINKKEIKYKLDSRYERGK